ncbi:hypothetical protein ACH5RR_018829 [Cinchona calisaya]|uniref:Uncharacterized protein n=1 Tax=Cinchona calisaya TaxID=153742 RepID=A0ABD2ZR77_9GENT
MAENMTLIMRRFNLCDKELEMAEIGEEESMPEIKKCSLNVLGKIVGSKVVNITGLQKLANQIWGQKYSSRKTGIGVVAKNWEGSILSIRALKELSKDNQSLEIVEAVRLTLIKVVQRNWRKILAEVENKTVVD